MDVHHVLTHLSTTSMRDITAFSALPDAPVLIDRPTRLQRLAAAWRTRRAGSTQTPSLRRPVTAAAARSATHTAKVGAAATDGCRMVA